MKNYSRRSSHFTLTVIDRYVQLEWNRNIRRSSWSIIIDIIDQTKQQRNFMVSHSQGTTVFFVMASERPEYQEKMISSFAFSPGGLRVPNRESFIPVASHLHWRYLCTLQNLIIMLLMLLWKLLITELSNFLKL